MLRNKFSYISLYHHTVLRFGSRKMDPYQILGVTSATTNEDVKNAFHRLSKLCNIEDCYFYISDHPDVSRSKDCDNKFKEISEAYRIISEERNQQAAREEELRRQYKDYVRKKNLKEFDYETRLYEEKIYKDIFGKSYVEDPSAFTAAENDGKRKLYEEKISKFKKKQSHSEDELFMKFASQFSNFEGSKKTEKKVEPIYEHYQSHSSSQTQQKIYLIGGFLIVALAGYYIFTRKPEVKKSLTEQQISKLRGLALEKMENDREEQRNIFANINNKMLKYNTTNEPDAVDMLTKLTIFPDIKFFAVRPRLFYFEREEELLKNKGKFEKIPIKNQKLNIRITHALEAERILQNIYVPVKEVLKQIEMKGRYEPPGIFMKFYGYIYFRIRKLPIQIQNLKAAKEHISLFDLFFAYQSPLPHYNYQYNEFKIKLSAEHKPENSNEWTFWQGNVQLNPKPIPKIYLQGDVKNIFIQRPSYTEDEGRYDFVWGSYYQK